MFHNLFWQLIRRYGHFNHFRGLILCNAKRLQFHKNYLKQIMTQFINYYIPFCCTLKFYGYGGSIHITLLPLISKAPLSFLMDAGWKIFLTQISSCIKVFNSKIYMEHPLSYLMSCSWLGNIMKSKSVWIQTLFRLIKRQLI